MSPALSLSLCLTSPPPPYPCPGGPLVAQNALEQIKDTAGRLPEATSQSTEVLDTCRRLEQLHQQHQTAELPQLRRVDTQLGELQSAVADIKAAMTKSLVERLRQVSILQSHIRCVCALCCCRLVLSFESRHTLTNTLILLLFQGSRQPPGAAEGASRAASQCSG